MTAVNTKYLEMNSKVIEELFSSYSTYRFKPQVSVYAQSSIEVIDEIDGIDTFSPSVSRGNRQQQMISEIAQRLVRLADEFEKQHEKTYVENGDGRTENKFHVVNKVINELKETVTPEAFNEALKTVCQHATTLPVELTLAFELATKLGPALKFIPRCLSDYFQSRVQMEDLMNLDGEEE